MRIKKVDKQISRKKKPKPFAFNIFYCNSSLRCLARPLRIYLYCTVCFFPGHFLSTFFCYKKGTGMLCWTCCPRAFHLIIIRNGMATLGTKNWSSYYYRCCFYGADCRHSRRCAESRTVNCWREHLYLLVYAQWWIFVVCFFVVCNKMCAPCFALMGAIYVKYTQLRCGRCWLKKEKCFFLLSAIEIITMQMKHKITPKQNTRQSS